MMNMMVLQKQFEVIDDTVKGVAHFVELAAVSRTIKDLFDIWMMVSIGLGKARTAYRLLEALVSEGGSKNPLDPEDKVSDGLLSDQVSVRKTLDRLSEFSPGRLHIFEQWLLASIKKKLLRQHELLGHIRTSIMEHDADCSPVIGAFDNAADLIDALRK